MLRFDERLSLCEVLKVRVKSRNRLREMKLFDYRSKKESKNSSGPRLGRSVQGLLLFGQIQLVKLLSTGIEVEFVQGNRSGEIETLSQLLRTDEGTEGRRAW